MMQKNSRTTFLRKPPYPKEMIALPVATGFHPAPGGPMDKVRRPRIAGNKEIATINLGRILAVATPSSRLGISSRLSRLEENIENLRFMG